MKTKYQNIFYFYLPLIILMIISLLNMLNAPLLDSSYHLHFIKQLIWYILGFIILFIFSKINITKVFKYSFYFYIFSLILLILVLLIGKEINGAKAWFTFKFFSFQPSELMKLALALTLTNIAFNSRNSSNDLTLILKVVLLTIIPSIFIFLEPDTGAIIFLFIIAFIILFLSLKHKWWLYLLIGLVFLILTLFIILYFNNKDLLISILGTSFFYRMERLITFTTNSSYQLENALTVIGSSSFWGTGLHKISLYIPEAPTDFIFAFTIGNFGLITGLIVLLCYYIIDIYLVKIFFKVKNSLVKLFLASFLVIFFFQQFINISMNLGLLPIIGIPLPFLSYGGSTIIIYFLFLGIILNLLKKEFINYVN